MYIVGLLELVVDESLDDSGFASGLVAQEDYFVLDFASNGHRWHTHLSDFYNLA